jgi:RNA polymerase sigma-70 factor, ECF subfamily
MTVSVAATSSAGEAEAEGCREDAFGGKRLLSELLVASGRHDEAAFARLYQLTSPWIYHLLRRRTRSTANAENAMCLVYTAIWQRAASFAPPNQSALAWVTTLAYDVVES